jgi:hypothetical protein
MVETFFKTLKPELVWRTMFETRQQAARPSAAIAMASPTPSGATPRSTSQAQHSSRK